MAAEVARIPSLVFNRTSSRQELKPAGTPAPPPAAQQRAQEERRRPGMSGGDGGGEWFRGMACRETAAVHVTHAGPLAPEPCLACRSCYPSPEQSCTRWPSTLNPQPCCPAGSLSPEEHYLRKKKRKSWPVRQRLWASFTDVITALAALEQVLNPKP